MVICLDEVVGSLSRFFNKGISDANLNPDRRIEYYEQIDGRCIGRIGIVSSLIKGHYLTKAGIAKMVDVSSSYLDPFLRKYGSKLKRIDGRWNLKVYRIDNTLVSLLPKIEETAKQFREGGKGYETKGKDVKKNLLPKKQPPLHGWVEYCQVISELEERYPDIKEKLGRSCVLFYEEADISYKIRNRSGVFCKKEDIDALKRAIVGYYFKLKKEGSYRAGVGSISARKVYRVVKSSERRTLSID